MFSAIRTRRLAARTPQSSTTVIVVHSQDHHIKHMVELCASAVGCGVHDHDTASLVADAQTAAVHVLDLAEATHIAATKGTYPGAIIVAPQAPSVEDVTAAMAIRARTVVDVSNGPTQLLEAITQETTLKAPTTVVVRPAHSGAPAAGVAALLARVGDATVVDLDIHHAELSCDLWPYLGPGATWGATPAGPWEHATTDEPTLPQVAGIPVLAFPNVSRRTCPTPKDDLIHTMTAGSSRIVASAGLGQGLPVALPRHTELIVCENHSGLVHQAVRHGPLADSSVLLVIEDRRADVCACDVASALGARRWRRWGAPASPSVALLTRPRSSWRTSARAIWKEAES